MPGETEQNESGWTVDTLNYYFQRQINDLRAMLDERYATQTKALDAAVSAQQIAMRTAFEAADKAVQTALANQEKAVNKAENAAERRFESVNEFRGQLNDQAKTFIPRAEAMAIIERNNEKIEELRDRYNATNSFGQGEVQQRSENRLNINMIVGIVGVLLIGVAFVVGLLV